MRIAAIIIGIDNWEKYTLPLVESILKHEPSCGVTVVDNDSYPSYPVEEKNWHRFAITRIRRACYSKAINHAQESAEFVHGPIDWYIVLSNDVLCTGPFAQVLAQYSDDTVVGPLLLETPIPGMGMIPYLEGWCMCFSRRCWDAIGGFDEKYLMSSFEDVDVSHEARKHGFALVEDTDLPFVHLDQRQRFYLPGYGGSEEHNMRYFMRKNGVMA